MYVLYAQTLCIHKLFLFWLFTSPSSDLLEKIILGSRKGLETEESGQTLWVEEGRKTSGPETVSPGGGKAFKVGLLLLVTWSENSWTHKWTNGAEATKPQTFKRQGKMGQWAFQQPLWKLKPGENSPKAWSTWDPRYLRTFPWVLLGNPSNDWERIKSHDRMGNSEIKYDGRGTYLRKQWNGHFVSGIVCREVPVVYNWWINR